MANFIKPYNNDSSVGHLSTPITSSNITKIFLSNLPAYRTGLSPLLRGLEVGMAHGYFLVGPFEKLGPLRNSPLALLVGFLSSIGLITILSLCLKIYGDVTFQKPSTFSERFSNKELQTSEGWNQFSSGFLVGAFGGSGVAYLILSNF
uniref:photosystem I subunit XI n=1 Tax=Vacuolaria virescens TaxID=44451 RepID=UPI0021141A61|nr:photosystem I subunit XI [Vacuolaria virescens]UTE94696.1 photosystem I subunit XI [Vacuolaria virescens]